MHAPSNTQHVNLHEGLWSEHLLESLKRILHQCIRRLKNIAASTLCDMVWAHISCVQKLF